ncbi:T9SS type A sorting domain-containing protein [Hyunsoonleella aestuarii]|uniref:Secretion system C-terminal sorting domain-containing protein n=1 Tax=Hyunsoonleella aestuarii TaxID=912802 RepID=A0ABP8EEL4_9FLAO|nr:T9SS type A sorting domain-containing protein [Hyunsoonleella aestuarii]
MKKTIQPQLKKRLTQYGALSAAIMGISNVEGQIGYFDVAPDYGGPDLTYDVRMNEENGDMDVDFQIQHEASVPYLAINIQDPSASVLGIKVTTPFNINYVSALSQSAVIGPTPPNSWMNDNGTISYNNCVYSGAYPNSQWCGLNGADRYIGVRFKIESTDTFHYGWIRISKSETPAGNWLIKDHGFNPTPEASIIAGEQITLSDKDVAFSKAKIIGLNKSIALFNIPNRTSYSILDISGKKVLNGQLEGRTTTINADSLSSGIYIIQVIDNDTKAVLRKKLVL